MLTHLPLQLEKDVDTLRKRLVALRTERQNQILVNTSILQSLQATLEKKKNSCKHQEEENTLSIDKKKDISREFTQTLQSIKNLYGRCFNTMRVKPMFTNLKENSSLVDVLENEFDLILTRIVDLMEITHEYSASDSIVGGGGGGGASVNTSGSVYSTDLKEMSTASNNNTARSTESKHDSKRR